jgi:hypothetical protein
VALEVLPALVKAPQSAVFDTAPADSKKTETSVEKTPEIREELFYQRSAAGTPVKLPLWKNKLFALILLLLVIPGTALGCVLWRNRKKDPEKELRQKELERIANALKQNLYRPEELERLLRSDVASFLSPGATPAEIAENLEDDELKEAFNNLFLLLVISRFFCCLILAILTPPKIFNIHILPQLLKKIK